MKLTITIALLICSISGMAQTKPKQKIPPIVTAIGKSTFGPDTVETYSLKYKEVELIYDLLSAGYQGVSTSDVFSKNQAKQYMQLVQRLDSLLKPQILKWHPVKGVKP